MVGRGTRIDEPTGKLMFRVYDYTNATRLFGHAFITHAAPSREPAGSGDGHPSERIVRLEGLEVHIRDDGRFIVTSVNGREALVTIYEYRQRLAEKLIAEAGSLDAFRRLWIVPSSRHSLMEHLPNGESGARLLRDVVGLEDCDLYDVLADIAYGLAPRTRPQRAEAFSYKNKRWLHGLPEPAAATLQALAAQFGAGGTEALENPHVFEAQAVRRAGGLAALQRLGKPESVLRK